MFYALNLDSSVHRRENPSLNLQSSRFSMGIDGNVSIFTIEFGPLGIDRDQLS